MIENAIGVILVALMGAFLLLAGLAWFLFIGWLVAIGLLFYGYPVGAFWAFVGWIAILVAFNGLRRRVDRA